MKSDHHPLNDRRITIRLPAQYAALIQQQIAKGRYQSMSEYLRDALERSLLRDDQRLGQQ